MANQGKRLDIIIFGATGFTGKIAVFEMIKLAKEKNVTWGIAGRNQSKLEMVLKEISEKSGEDVTQVTVVIADVTDEESVVKMAAQARVIVNCVGPYRFHGEAVVKSCLAGGAHYVDICAEQQFFERMQVEYNKMAADRGLYVVSACGMDCIPTDLGVVFLKKQFQGDVNSVEVYMGLVPRDPPLFRAVGHYTTYESFIHVFANTSELPPLHEKLFPNPLPTMEPKLKSRSMIHHRDEVGWCFSSPTADCSVIRRSQKHFFEEDKERPVQAEVYVATKSLIKMIILLLLIPILMLLLWFKCGRNILLKYPSFFTAGLFTHEGPSEKTRKKTNYKVTFFGEGWKEKAAQPTDQHEIPPNKKVVTEVTCNDPGYGSTGVMLLLSAITVLKESDKMPGRGGVYTTGAAFAKTSLIDELNSHGIKFTVTSSSEM